MAQSREEALASGRSRRAYQAPLRTTSKQDVPSSSLPKWDQPAEAAKPGSTDDKLAALRRFRRARGLCDKCAEKWSYGHKCTAAAHLHALEEVCDLLIPEEPEPPDSQPDLHANEEQLFMSSRGGWGVSEITRTLKFEGFIQDQPVLILLDSGSSHSFLHEKFQSLLPSWFLHPCKC